MTQAREHDDGTSRVTESAGAASAPPASTPATAPSPPPTSPAPGAPAEPPAPVPPPGPPGTSWPVSLPRGLMLVVGVAGVLFIAGSMRAIPGILGPVFLALVLTVLVDPIRAALIRRHGSRALASMVAFVVALLIMVGLVAATVVGIVQFIRLIPQYSDEWSATLAQVQAWLASQGLTGTGVSSMLQNVSPGTIASAAESLLSGLTGVVSGTLLTIVLLIFLAVDGTVFPKRFALARPGHEIAFDGLRTFASGTRRYFGVATIFGGIVAVLDTAALLVLGVPAAFLWGLLAFVTNYIPNVGFIIGLIPPTFLAFLQGGPSLAIAVLVTYCVLNFIIQSVLQPKFVGDAVGLTTTMSFLSLIVWTFILGPIGAILAIPASLLFKGLMVDIDPRARWLQLVLGDPSNPNTEKPPRTKESKKESKKDAG